MEPSREQSGAVGTLAWNLVVAASFFFLIYLPAEDAFLQRDVPGSYRGLVELLPIGIAYTLGVTVAGSLAAMLVGLIVAFGKISGRRPLELAASLYTEALRGIPLLVFLFYIYYALGEIFQVPKLLAAVLGFGLSYGAYMADVFRAGIEAVPKEQGEAARSLGMNAQEAMFQIILPQALRTIIPAIGNQTLGMLKDTSLVSVLAISDILRVANQYAATHFNYFETYTYVALTYMVLTLGLSKLMTRLEEKVRIH